MSAKPFIVVAVTQPAASVMRPVGLGIILIVAPVRASNMSFRLHGLLIFSKNNTLTIHELSRD